jgi:hypothetical protein
MTRLSTYLRFDVSASIVVLLALGGVATAQPAGPAAAL